MRVAFIINSLGYGGAERVLSILLAHAERCLPTIKLDLVLLDDEPERRSIPACVEKHVLNAGARLGDSTLKLARLLRSLNPDIVVSFLVRANVATVIASRLAGVPCIISERMHLTRHLTGKYAGLRRRLAQWAPRLTYRFADLIVAVSSGVRDDLITHYGAPSRRTLCLPNPYDLAGIAEAGRAPAPFALPERFMVSVGRLDRSKNFAGLIEAFIQSELPDGLVILGEGPERAALEALIRERGETARILLPGYLENPFAVVAKARCFVSASTCEGFPNAMAEAMALGVPAIATDCLSGPAELLAGLAKANPTDVLEAPYGVLVPEQDTPALARAMRLMADSDARAHYAAQAKSRIAAFAAERVAQDYWNVIDAARRAHDAPRQFQSQSTAQSAGLRARARLTGAPEEACSL